MKRLVRYFVHNRLMTNWLMLLIFAAGTFGLLNLKKRIWPMIEFDWITVELGWPGASALEVEEGLVLPLEEGLRGIEGIEKVSSTASDGWANFGLETSSRSDISRIMDKVRQELESAGLPEDADKPVIYQETEWNRVMLLFIYGPDDPALLEDVAEEFKEELLRTGELTQINSWGFPPEKIILEPRPETLTRYGLSLQDIDQAVRSGSLDLSAGSILTETEQIQIRTYEKKRTIPEFENLPVKVLDSGRILRLKDISSIRRGRAENAVFTRANGKNAIGLQIMYGNNEDVVAISKIVDEMLPVFQERYRGAVTFKTYIRDVDELHERLGTLSASGLGGLFLVMLILGLFLNTRISFWVAMGIPISFMGLVFLEWIMGITINEMSLFGMIMIIGILVDDGIVIGESIYDHWHRLGKSRRQAAVDGTMEVLSPVLVSIATTIVAFAPYFFIYGEMGKYVSQIGLVVIVSLLFSLVEAVILLPAHLSHSAALSEEARTPGPLRARLLEGQDYLVNNIYAPALDFALGHRAVILSVLAGALMVSAGAFAGQHIRAAFFPEIESPYVYAEFSFPAGTTALTVDEFRERTEDFMLDFGKGWAEDDRDHENAVVDYLSWGNGTKLWVYLILLDNDERDFTVNEFSLALAREMPEDPVLESMFIGNDSIFGGSPISIRFLGRSDRELRRAAELFKDELSRMEGVKDIRDDTPLGEKEFVIRVNDRGRALGLTTADVAGQLRRSFYGSEIMTLQEGRDEIPVILRYPLDKRDSLSRVEELLILSPSGARIPFKEIAEYKIQRSRRRIRRENGYRSLRVMAGIDSEKAELNVVMDEINNRILPEILEKSEGISLSQGGQAEQVNKMIRSMLFSMGLALLLMFTLLLFEMKSWGQALLVLSLIPLGFLGAVYGHMIMGRPVSFISFLGSVALGGIIVNDSVVLIDCFNKKLKAGIPRSRAVREAAIQRFRPIIMTTLTTSIGLTPLISQKSVGGQMLVPIGISIAWGLIFGTFLTLGVLPVVLSMMKSRQGEQPVPG